MEKVSEPAKNDAASESRLSFRWLTLARAPRAIGFERSALAMAKDGSDAEPTAFVKLPDPTTGAFVEADVRSYLKEVGSRGE